MGADLRVGRSRCGVPASVLASGYTKPPRPGRVAASPRPEFHQHPNAVPRIMDSTSFLTKRAPATLDANVGLIDTPGFVGRLEMTAQPLLEFRPVALNPSPDRSVVGLQAALGEQLFDIAERE